MSSSSNAVAAPVRYGPDSGLRGRSAAAAVFGGWRPLVRAAASRRGGEGCPKTFRRPGRPAECRSRSAAPAELRRWRRENDVDAEAAMPEFAQVLNLAHDELGRLTRRAEKAETAGSCHRSRCDHWNRPGSRPKARSGSARTSCRARRSAPTSAQRRLSPARVPRPRHCTCWRRGRVAAPAAARMTSDKPVPNTPATIEKTR